MFKQCLFSAEPYLDERITVNCKTVAIETMDNLSILFRFWIILLHACVHVQKVSDYTVSVLTKNKFSLKILKKVWKVSIYSNVVWYLQSLL